MNHELVCTWLELPKEKWPPDHYALLGLPVAEPDIERIEQQVHERLARLRTYQMNYPDQVTEAMNRLAQAFTCLTDPQAKKAYDNSLLHPPAPQADLTQPAPELPQAVPFLVQEGGDPLAWLFGPWSQPDAPQPAAPPAPPPQPVHADWTSTPPPSVRNSGPAVPAQEPAPVTNGAVETPAPPAPQVPPPAAKPAPPPASPPEPVDPVVEAAQRSKAARRGLGTKRSLYARIAGTRELLWCWDQVGRFMNRPKVRLTKAADAAELNANLDRILDLLRHFPPLLGGPGQPGYYIVVLARQPTFVQTFRTLEPKQREELARDWRDGRELLLSHRRFLRQELRALRQKSPWGRLVRAARALITDHQALLLLMVGLLALLTALWFYWHPYGMKGQG